MKLPIPNVIKKYWVKTIVVGVFGAYSVIAAPALFQDHNYVMKNYRCGTVSAYDEIGEARRIRINPIDEQTGSRLEEIAEENGFKVKPVNGVLFISKLEKHGRHVNLKAITQSEVDYFGNNSC